MVSEKLSMIVEERRVSAGIHGFYVVVDECLFGGSGGRDVEIKGSMAETRFRRASGWPTKIFDRRRIVDIDNCMDTSASECRP